VQDRRISQTKYHCYVIESRYTQHGTYSLATSFNAARIMKLFLVYRRAV